MKKKLEAALEHISDEHIQEAASYRKKRRLAPWIGSLAACLALCILLGAVWSPLSGSKATDPVATLTDPAIDPTWETIPVTQQQFSIAAPAYPKMAAYPLGSNSSYDAWRKDQIAIRQQPEGYADSLQAYFARSTPLLLSGKEGENAVCSPLNIYMALAMLAEVTDGQTRAQILTLLNADSLEALRTQANQVWKAHYCNDGLSTSILGASLWLSEDYTCNEATAQRLADSYYASVFRGDLGSEEMNAALRSWLSQQTDGLLDEYVGDVAMDPRTVLALATTLSYQVQWIDFFQEEDTVQRTFHGSAGDTTEDFLSTTLSYGPYYWSERFGAVSLNLEDGSHMWLFLPDEGVTPEQLMADGDLFDFLEQNPRNIDGSYANQKNLIVNLAFPKFDISAEKELTQQLKALGVTDAFQAGTADFTPIFPEEDGGYVSEVKHAARVAVDEQGVTAAAFTLILRCGAGMPPQEEMDLTFDRPFAFIIESQDGLPLFTGIVNEP